ncbi:MAG: hypothetical protein KDE58_13530 [Caldilineaceae bacterium]|nr:hypothetical protein [Caldilineaceae bacterium]
MNAKYDCSCQSNTPLYQTDSHVKPLALAFSSCLLILALLLATAGASTKAAAQTTPVSARVDYPLYVPVIYNGAGDRDNAANYQVAYVNKSGAWLSSLDGNYLTQLTTDIQYGVEEDIPVLQVAPDGQLIAVQQSTGWALFRRDGTLAQDRIGQGFALTWDRVPAGQPLHSVLLSQLGHGIDRYDFVANRQTPFLITSDDTNDHSLTWTTDGTKFVFAHQEFGTQLYVTIVDPYDVTQLPLTGENLAADKDNAALAVIEAVDSWHDQPVTFFWAANGEKLIFAAKQTIYVVDMASEDAVTIVPPGFGERFTGRSIDVSNDLILYFANDGLYTVHFDGTGTQRVVASNDLHFPRWIAAGQRILYRGTDDRLYQVNANGDDIVAVPYSNDIVQFAPLP